MTLFIGGAILLAIICGAMNAPILAVGVLLTIPFVFLCQGLFILAIVLAFNLVMVPANCIISLLLLAQRGVNWWYRRRPLPSEPAGTAGSH
jgi:hypothetical protein